MKPKFKPEEKGPMDKFVMVNIFSCVMNCTLKSHQFNPSCFLYHNILTRETTDFNGFGNLIQLLIS